MVPGAPGNKMVPGAPGSRIHGIMQLLGKAKKQRSSLSEKARMAGGCWRYPARRVTSWYPARRVRR